MDFEIDGGIASIVPEFFVLDFSASRRFWTEIVGFDVVFEREGYAYLRLGKVEVMIAQACTHWKTGKFDTPLGRGANMQIFVEDPDALVARFAAAGWPLFEQLSEAWPASGGVARGYRQFLVQDPNGYLLRFAKKLGVKPSVKDSPPPVIPIVQGE